MELALGISMARGVLIGTRNRPLSQKRRILEPGIELIKMYGRA